MNQILLHAMPEVHGAAVMQASHQSIALVLLQAPLQAQQI